MPASRRRIRELAMQVLFLWDSNGSSDPLLAAQVGRDDADVDDEARREALSMATGAWDAREATDAWVARLAPQWPPKRQPNVDRNILRLAAWEMTSGRTPAKVVIDEAIELAKSYSTEQSPGFVNAVLDAIHKEHRELTQGLTAGDEWMEGGGHKSEVRGHETE
jgi:N utilization substance protein B